MESHPLPPFESYNGPLPYAFISYAHKDSAAVFTEIARLHVRGYRIWYDDGIHPGSEWADEIAIALHGCACFIVLCPPTPCCLPMFATRFTLRSIMANPSL